MTFEVKQNFLSISTGNFLIDFEISAPFYMNFSVHVAPFYKLFSCLFRRSFLHRFWYQFPMIFKPLETWKCLFFLGKTIHFYKFTFSKTNNFSNSFRLTFYLMFLLFGSIFQHIFKSIFLMVLGTTFFDFRNNFLSPWEPLAAALKPFSRQEWPFRGGRFPAEIVPAAIGEPTRKSIKRRAVLAPRLPTRRGLDPRNDQTKHEENQNFWHRPKIKIFVTKTLSDQCIIRRILRRIQKWSQI